MCSVKCLLSFNTEKFEIVCRIRISFGYQTVVLGSQNGGNREGIPKVMTESVDKQEMVRTVSKVGFEESIFFLNQLYLNIL